MFDHYGRRSPAERWRSQLRRITAGRTPRLERDKPVHPDQLPLFGSAILAPDDDTDAA